MAVLRDELETAMRLCGITDLNQVRGDMSWLNTAELEQYLPPTSGLKGGILGGLFKSRL
jgi:L-lactate dehydrogenase (cytochrome)